MGAACFPDCAPNVERWNSLRCRRRRRRRMTLPMWSDGICCDACRICNSEPGRVYAMGALSRWSEEAHDNSFSVPNLGRGHWLLRLIAMALIRTTIVAVEKK